MSDSGEEAAAWLRRATGGGGSIHMDRMKGSTSSSIYRVGLEDGRRFVLRVLDKAEWLAEEPDLAEHEAAALTEARRAGLKAPGLVAYSTEDVGFGAPVVLMTFVEGRIELRPQDFDAWIDGLARELAAIHVHSGEGFPWTFLSWADKTVTGAPSWTAVPELWERMIARVRGGEPAYEPVFIHRDYHPMNVLWDPDGKIGGVVDWVNACRGPSSVDVAHCRTNLAGMYGAEAAEGFLERYLANGGRPFDPYWDLDSLVDMCVGGPSYYEPWRDFGLGEIAPETLIVHMDEHLERVMEMV